jgi:transposase
VRDDRPAGSRDPPGVWYRYSQNRKAEHPRAYLRAFHGILQADAYSGFAALYEGERILEASCWAHARRKFYDICIANKSPIAAEVIQRIARLYAVEREIRGQQPCERAAVRQQNAGPLLEELHAWLSARLRSVSAKSQLAGAIHYALVRWRALTRYRDDGRIEIDNNSAERAIRPIVLGRRNYLFAGSDADGERAANIYSLIGTAMLNAMDAYVYLRHVLERIAEHPINRIDELLPWNVAAKLPEAVRQAA